MFFPTALAAAAAPAATAPAPTAVAVAADALVAAADVATPEVAALNPLDALVLTPELEKPLKTELVTALVATTPVAETVTTWPVNTLSVCEPTVRLMLSAAQERQATVVFPPAKDMSPTVPRTPICDVGVTK